MSNTLVQALSSSIQKSHTAAEDVYVQIPDVKHEDMVPWTMPGTWYYPLCLDCQSNQMTLFFKMSKGLGIHTHYHCGQTFAYTLQGRWHYVEQSEKVMVPGTFILEFPGVEHTVQVTSNEPVLMIANMRSGFLFVEPQADGSPSTIKMYQDPYYFYYRAKQFYEEEGKDFSRIEMVTTLGSGVRQASWKAEPHEVAAQ